MDVTYEYIIVGAGTAGCVLASRLSADPDAGVLLVEAGASDIPPTSRSPDSWPLTLGTQMDWGCVTEPQRRLDGRSLPYAPGKILGGSSAINALAHIRGSPRDFDAWRDAGNVGWGYEDVLPYFRRSERRDGGPSPYHGSDGPLTVSDPASVHPLTTAFVEAVQSLGVPFNADLNGEEQLGVGYYQRTIKEGHRHSAADAFLEPVRGRPNLTVITDAHVTRIRFDGTTATGISFVHGGSEKAARASREVVLSAGGIGIADHSAAFRRRSGRRPGANRHQRARRHTGCGLQSPRSPEDIAAVRATRGDPGGR